MIMSDFISRQAAIENIKTISAMQDGVISDFAAISAILSVPSADVRENVKGEWILKSTNGEWFDCCSKCGYVEWDNPSNFCPNCGADMRQRSEE